MKSSKGRVLRGASLFFPLWRYATWLRAVARAKSTATDEARVLAWIRALKILAGLGFGILAVVSAAALLSLGFYALPIALAAPLIGFVIFKMPGAVYGWVYLQTGGQNSPGSHASRLPLRQLSSWIRATQTLSLLGLMVVPNGGPFLSLSSLWAVASTGAIIYALELTLCFAHASARSTPNAPTPNPA